MRQSTWAVKQYWTALSKRTTTCWLQLCKSYVLEKPYILFSSCFLVQMSSFWTRGSRCMYICLEINIYLYPYEQRLKTNIYLYAYEKH